VTHTVVHRAPGRYAAFPHIAAAPDGALIAVFREAGAETAKRALTQEHTHQDRDSRIMCAQSTDGGITWSAPVCIHESPEYAVNDPAVTVLRDGSYLVRFCRWRIAARVARRTLDGPVHRHNVRDELVLMMAGSGFVRSGDGGRTWTAVDSEVADQPLVGAMSREPVLELGDGTLVLPVYMGYPAATESVWLLRSWDGGATWADASLIAGEPGQVGRYRHFDNFNETAIVDTGAGDLLAVVRRDSGFETAGGTFIAEGGVGELAWTRSRDAGFTWDPLRPTGIWGQPGHLLRLASGDLICTYGHRRPPFGVRASLVSVAGGEWRVRRDIVLRDDGASWDVGYPASVETAPGEIFTIYYLHGDDGVRHIAGTRWRVADMADRPAER
jgi:sialidase-1